MQPVKLSSNGKPVVLSSGYVAPKKIAANTEYVEPVQLMLSGYGEPITLDNDPQGFLPSSISSQIIWVDSLNETFDSSSRVSSWTNRVSGGDNYVQATNANKPIITANILGGLPVVRFNGTTQFMSIATKTLVGAFTEVFVIATDDIVAASGRFFLGNSAGTIKCGIENSKLTLTIVTDTDNSLDVPVIAGEFMILTITRNASNKVDVYIDDGTANRLFSDAAQVGSHVFDRLGVDEASHYWDGDIAEHLVYSKELSGTERGNLVTFLKNKYGI